MPSLRLLAVASLLATAACAGSAPPPVQPAPEPARAEAVPSAPPAAVAAPAKPPAEACEGITACAAVGIDLAKKGDPTAKVALVKACPSDDGDRDACATLAVLLDAEGADPAAVLAAAAGGCSVRDGASEMRGKACLLAGNALRAREPRTAEKAFAMGCELGSREACKARRDLLASERAEEDAASGVPGANLSIGSVTANGATVQQIACKTDGGLGGLFGSLVLAKPFADKKAALDACAKSPHTTRVRWTAKGGRMSDVHVISGDDPSNRCVERVLSGAVAAVAGTCAASVDIGKAKKK